MQSTAALHSLFPEPPALRAVVGGRPVGGAPLDGGLAADEGVEPLPDVADLAAERPLVVGDAGGLAHAAAPPVGAGRRHRHYAPPEGGRRKEGDMTSLIKTSRSRRPRPCFLENLYA